MSSRTRLTRICKKIRGTSDFAAYAQALERFMVADLEHLELVSMRERQRADEVAAMAEGVI